MNSFTIGKVAKSTGLGIETVRFYEREGLIEPLARTKSNGCKKTDRSKNQ